MYWIIISVAMAVVFLTVGIIVDKKYWNAFIGIVCYLVGSFSLITSIFLGLSLIERNTFFEEKISEYNNLKAVIEETRGVEPNTALAQQVVEMNTTIDNHRNELHSGWWGVWRSEKIANLEKLHFDN